MAAPTEEEILALVSSLGTASAVQDPYETAVAEFASVSVRKPSGIEGAVSAIRGLAGFTAPDPQANTGTKKPFLESATGKIMYENGAIFDPATGQTLFPTKTKQAASIQGSAAWLAKIQDEWSDDKVGEWRKKLASQGYDVADKGGMAYDLLLGLQEYHANRYANFGKALPKAPGGDTAADAPNIRKTFDKQALKEELKSWGYEVFGEDLADDETDYFADRVLDVAGRLARKHGDEWSASQIQEGAKLRVQKEFAKDPAVSDALDEMEELEGNTTLRNSIVSVSQLGSI